MLKITPEIRNKTTRLTVEGRLVGPWVTELERSWHEVKRSGSLVVDLMGLTFVDEAGKALLHRMWHDGVELVAADCCTRALIEGMTGRTGPCNR